MLITLQRVSVKKARMNCGAATELYDDQRRCKGDVRQRRSRPASGQRMGSWESARYNGDDIFHPLLFPYHHLQGRSSTAGQFVSVLWSLAVLLVVAEGLRVVLYILE